MSHARITQSEISDTLIERPITFTLRRRRFALYPPTLGKVQLISRLWGEINPTAMTGKTQLELLSGILSSARTRRGDCLRLLAYATLPGAECINENSVSRRIKELSHIDTADLASLVVTAVSMDKTGAIQSYYEIDRESERMKRVLACKDKESGSASFGGKAVWGTLIDTACERYGWSYQYVLWGISFTNLQLLLSDQVRTIFLSEDERKRARKYLTADSDAVRAEDAKSLRAFVKSENWS